MRLRSLNVKLVIAFLAVSLVGTALIALYVARTTTNRFGEYVFERYLEEISHRTADYYRLKGSWEGIAEAMPPRFWAPHGWRKAPGSPSSSPQQQEPVEEARRFFAIVDQQHRVIVAGLSYKLGDSVSHREVARGVPVEVNGTVVGTVIAGPLPFLRPDPRQGFLAGFYRALGVGTAGATVAALILGVLLARSLTRPLKELTRATQAMSRGDLAQRVPVHSRDELGELARSFNQMSAELARSTDLRRQMTADIAHELRTPLSLILGHAEALSDGVLPPTPETFEIIYDEAQGLARLVEDLRTLSLSDAGELPLHRQPVAPQELLERAAGAHRPQAQAQGIDLTVDVPSGLAEVDVDSDRIAQVLHNALRHTPKGGRVALKAHLEDGNLYLVVQDSGPGIPPEELESIFERFYRTDRSRHHQEGGTGLGLAIARSIVEAHGGRIWAESEPGQGASFYVALPAA